jgi:hypothetical protein
MIVMPYYEEKIRLIIELKAETLNQLVVVQAEDPEEFLYSTERCNAIIESLEFLRGVQLKDELRMEWRAILQEIAEIRNQISILIQPLYEKIKQKAEAEKQINFVKRRYNQDNQPVPSIFLDKKI